MVMCCRDVASNLFVQSRVESRATTTQKAVSPTKHTTVQLHMVPKTFQRLGARVPQIVGNSFIVIVVWVAHTLVVR